MAAREPHATSACDTALTGRFVSSSDRPGYSTREARPDPAWTVDCAAGCRHSSSRPHHLRRMGCQEHTEVGRGQLSQVLVGPSVTLSVCVAHSYEAAPRRNQPESAEQTQTDRPFPPRTCTRTPRPLEHPRHHGRLRTPLRRHQGRDRTAAPGDSPRVVAALSVVTAGAGDQRVIRPKKQIGGHSGPFGSIRSSGVSMASFVLANTVPLTSLSVKVTKAEAP